MPRSSLNLISRYPGTPSIACPKFLRSCLVSLSLLPQFSYFVPHMLGFAFSSSGSLFSPLSKNNVGASLGRPSLLPQVPERSYFPCGQYRPPVRPRPARNARYPTCVSTATSLESDFDSDTHVASSSEPSPRKSQQLPIVAVIGRPNVGKSTLVNRLSGKFRTGAIVENVVGITRDRTYRRSEWNGRPFALVDTGGLVFDDQSTFLPEIRAQAMVAIREASAVILCVDGQAGVNPLDSELASFLRREVSKSSAVFVAVNKCEGIRGELLASEFWTLGLGEPIPVSAIHGTGTGDLLDSVVEKLPIVEEESDDNVINVAIVGRPNVGKSSLLNVLTGKERAIVSEIPGTTRDAVDEIIKVNGQRYRLIDTAGIRRKSQVNFGTEFFMINRAFRSIRRSDVVLLLIDIEESSEQDRKIADRIVDEGKGCVVLANKWDLIPDKDNRSYRKAIDFVKQRMVSIPWADVELISVLQKQRTSKILSMVNNALEQHRRRISTAILNEVLKEAIEWHKPPSTRQGKQGRIYYCTQVSSAPPAIALFVNDPKLFSDNYRRYMEGQFRKSLGFSGTPLRLLWRGKARPPTI